MPAVAVTDTNNLFGALEFALSSSSSGIQPIIGCQLSVGMDCAPIVLLVQSHQGYLNLSKLVSDAFLEVDPSEKPHVQWDNLAENAEGLICLSGGLAGPIGQYLLHNQDKEAKEIAKKMKSIFGDRLYIELQRHNLAAEDQIEDRMIEIAYKQDIPLVATNDCFFARRNMHEAHDALLCIAEGRYISEEDRRKVTADHYFKSSREMESLFSDVPEAITNTAVIAQRCHFLLEVIDPILPPFDTEGGRSEEEELADQSRRGLEWRLENFVFEEGQSDKEKEEIAKPYFERLDFELGIIRGMGFPGYFLIVSDFIKWAKEQNIPVGPGRGSGAGSVVAWALKITDLDPLRFNLLFERFLNPERVSMPDFDVVFCQERRDEVIKYVQDKYGYDKVAQIITFGKLQARAVVRDTGRVLQMPYGQVDRIAKMIPANPANPVTLQEALDGDPDLRLERKKEETTDNLITIALQLEGLYRHASTHAAGVVIGDRKLHELVPLYRDPRSDMPVTQFNMKYVEQAGLVKFDFLGLKTMTVIQKAVEHIKAVRGEDIDILQVPLDDEATYKLMSDGHTVGVFQLESTGMRDTLRKMKPDRFEDIIALVSLYRPGPMDNIPSYIDRKEGREEPDYLHPLLKPLLEETYGIMIYQEQVMQCAQVLAGYTLGGADLLRRAMGKKIQAEMDKQRELFVKGAKEHNDVPAEQSEMIFDQIAKFAGYGFNKSHAAAYALIAYWTGWLKANYPVEFMAASMTLDLGNTEKLSVFKQELDQMGIDLLQPCVNHSNSVFKVENGAVRYALGALKSVGEQAMFNLVTEREENGPYKDLEDFANRIDTKSMNKRQFENLASAGAFECLDMNRAKVHGAAEIILKHAQSQAAERESGQVSLFAAPDGSGGSPLPPLPDVKDWDPLERLRKEFAAIGFYLSAHPLDGKVEQFKRLDITSYAEVAGKLQHSATAPLSMAGILIKQQIKVSPKGNKYAFLQLSDSSGVYEGMIFSEGLARAKEYLKVGEPFLLKVIAEEREEQLRFTVQDIKPLDAALEMKVREVQIRIHHDSAIEKIKQTLDQEGKGRAVIKLLIDLDDGKDAEVILPEKWSFTGAARNELLREEGVVEILEI